jgi:hypothetical protein
MANVHFEETRAAGPRSIRPKPTLVLLALGIVALLFAVLTSEPPVTVPGQSQNLAPSATMAIEDWRGNSARLPARN